ncbi:hypothetical protein WJ542_27175 [Paraburkholderia sp. B3]|uniref:hypothetical protein n=1 Tax=Paraburkholderia sp. B3 TaxID=3134791 RepID=UPI003982C761
MSPLSLIDVSSLRDRAHSIVGDDRARSAPVDTLRARDEIGALAQKHDSRFALTGAIFAGILISFGALVAAHVMFGSNGTSHETRNSH